MATDLGQKVQPVPNFTASYPRVDMRQYPASVGLSIRIGNNGWAATPPSTVTFYRMLAGSTTPVKLDTAPFAEIAPGAYRDVSMTLSSPAAADLSFYAVVNEQAPVVTECNTADNKSPLYTVKVSRDIVIVGVVAIVNLAIGPRTFRPSMWGKLTTATFIVPSVVVMFYNWRRESSLVIAAFVWTSLALTVISSADYFFKLRRLINEPHPAA